MNCCLQFKLQGYSEAYAQNFQTQIKRRVTIALIATLLDFLCAFIVYFTDKYSKSIFFIALLFARTLAALFLTCVLCLIQKKSRFFEKFARKINIVFDLAAIISFFSVLELLLDVQDGRFKMFGLIFYGWSMGSKLIPILEVVGDWRFRIAAHISITLTFFFIIIVQGQSEPGTLIINGVESILLYALISYINEKYQRISFLEKRAIEYDSRAVTKILDDITDGILIFDRKGSIFYSNKIIQKKHMQVASHINHFFSRLKVNSITPNLNENNTKSIATTIVTEVSSIRWLSECCESIFFYLSNRSTQEEECVSVSSEETGNSHRRYLIKFTTSLYHKEEVFVANIIDTTDRDELIIAQDNDKYKTRLLASVSHELRTPLNASMNFTDQALSDPQVSEEAKQKYLLPAFRSNKMLLSLINDILDFSQLQRNRLRLFFESKNIVQQAKECMELLEIQAEKKGIKLELQSLLAPDQEEVLTDHNRLKQIILNLLSNAVKFTFQGGVTLKLEESQNSIAYGKRRIKVSCIDTGIGITEENQQKLFRAYEKIELGNKTAINSTGVGLGLVISNNIAQKLNSANLKSEISSFQDVDARQINFTSKTGEGSCFYFEVLDRKDHDSEISESDQKSCADMSIFDDKPLELKAIQELERDFPHNQQSLSDIPMSSNRNDTGRTLLSRREEIVEISKNCSCPNVLIVDDDVFNLTALDQNLSKLSLKCEWAYNGLQALEKLKHRQLTRCSEGCKQFKVLLLDCNMPIMDGFETARQIRKMIANREIDPLKVVACTAFVQAEELDQMMGAGMDDYCTKPVVISVLKKKLQDCGLNLEV